MGNLDEFLPSSTELRTLPGAENAFTLPLREGDKIIGIEAWRITGPGQHGFVIATSYGDVYLLKFGDTGEIECAGPLKFEELSHGKPS